jgi:hypothetical protein
MANNWLSELNSVVATQLSRFWAARCLTRLLSSTVHRRVSVGPCRQISMMVTCRSVTIRVGAWAELEPENRSSAAQGDAQAAAAQSKMESKMLKSPVGRWRWHVCDSGSRRRRSAMPAYGIAAFNNSTTVFN